MTFVHRLFTCTLECLSYSGYTEVCMCPQPVHHNTGHTNSNHHSYKWQWGQNTIL